MDRITKGLALILILTMTLSSLSPMLAKPANAQTATPTPSHSPIPIPSVPEFTVKIVDKSYDVPTTYGVNAYTGANETHPGYHVENRTIELTIENQPFTPLLVHEGSSNWTAYLYYNVQTKGQYEDNWVDLYYLEDEHPVQSNSDYTVISYQLDQDWRFSDWSKLPAGAQVDFQVEAMAGFFSRIYNASATNQLEMFPWGFTGQESGWSNKQTVTIGSTSALPSPTTSVPEFPVLTILPLLLSIFSISILLRDRKTAKA